MQLIKIYFEYVQNPTQALKNLIEKPQFKQACWGYLFAALAWVVFFNVGDGLTVPEFLLKLLVVFAAELTAGSLIASLCGLFLAFRGKQITPAQLFVLVGSSGFIKGLFIAFALISAFFPQAGLGMLAPLAILFVYALQLVYLTLALRRMENTSISLSLASWVFSVVPVIALFAVLGAFLVWMIILIV